MVHATIPEHIEQTHATLERQPPQIPKDMNTWSHGTPTAAIRLKKRRKEQTNPQQPPLSLKPTNEKNNRPPICL